MITNTLPPPDEMYTALVERDSSYDGIFITAVRTTGIFCRPSCPARKPYRENVEFFVNSRRPCWPAIDPAKDANRCSRVARPPPGWRVYWMQLRRTHQESGPIRTCGRDRWIQVGYAAGSTNTTA